ncbi:MAG: deoxyadenosine/deoxycytidine kinase [Methylobacteriaceae bacterium]|jgi:deoxyadenosine/deoxycytidine kinase|nr:deoxyadenosine/deoxycytidine kinase [Methylobacteriaceae bacterium]
MLIVISGNIATGKTTLAGRLAERLSAVRIEEDVSSNEFLGDFYFDMTRWAFHSQVSFMAARVRGIRETLERPQTAILDRSLDEDFFVFARNLHRLGHLSEREYRLLFELRSLLAVSLPKPALWIFLFDEPRAIFDRLMHRGNAYESKIELSYIETLNQLYEKWRQSLPRNEVLEIRTSERDFRTDEGFEAVYSLIRNAAHAHNLPA